MKKSPNTSFLSRSAEFLEKSSKSQLSCVVATSMIVGGAAHGASIISGGTDRLVAGDVNDPYIVSVNSANAGYANTYNGPNTDAAFLGQTIEKSFNNPVVAYRFVGVTGNNTNRTMQTRAVDSPTSIVSQMTNPEEASKTGFDSFGQNVQGIISQYTGSSLLAYEDAYVNPGQTWNRDFNAGIRDLSGFSGTVDITGMTEGSIYIFYGQYNAGGGLSLTADMNGGVLPTVSSTNLYDGNPAPVAQQNIFVTRMDFVNDLGYETLSYTSNGSRLVGAVVTAVPEPSALGLTGLAGLLILARRRR